VPADEPVGSFNLITIDLSPLRDGVWGDCARSFPIENGHCTFRPQTPDFSRGIKSEAALHRAMQAFVKPATTFEDLFSFGNAEINRLGFENLDYLGNLGHSIASRRDDRRFIEQGNSTSLGSVPFFTFEPHIRQSGGVWGFKYEDIYFFDSERRIHAL
jgi:Metallopeptidase family M24